MISFNASDLNAVVAKWTTMRTSIIKPTLRRRAHGPNYWYRLRLVEKSEDDIPVWKKLDNCCIWSEKQLENWSDCRRVAWDTWDFKHREDAEKFITMFYLRWC